MRLGLDEVKWGYVGAKLANGDDDDQVEFVKGFIKECLAWGTKYQVQVQLASVNHKLTPDEREIISMLGYEAKEGE